MWALFSGHLGWGKRMVGNGIGHGQSINTCTIIMVNMASITQMCGIANKLSLMQIRNVS